VLYYEKHFHNSTWANPEHRQASNSSDSDAVVLEESHSASRAEDSTDGDANTFAPTGADTLEFDYSLQEACWPGEEDEDDVEQSAEYDEEDEDADEETDEEEAEQANVDADTDQQSSSISEYQSADSAAVAAPDAEAMQATGQYSLPQETREASPSPSEPGAKRRRIG
jgi:hypothetical protein